MNMKNYPTIHVDTNFDKGTSLFYILQSL